MDLYEAVQKNDNELVEKLLTMGADVNEVHETSGLTPLGLAVSKGTQTMAKLLIDHGADVGAREQDVVNPSGRVTHVGNNNPLLSEAATQPFAGMTELLIKAGADVNAKSSGGYTPLLVAAGRGNTAVVKALLEAGADPSIVGSSGKTALQLAQERGYTETAEVLRTYK